MHKKLPFLVGQAEYVLYIWRLCVCADTWVLLTVRSWLWVFWSHLTKRREHVWVFAQLSTSADLPVRSWVLSFLNNTSLFFGFLIPWLPIWFHPPSRWPNLIILLNLLFHPSLNHSLSPNCISTDFLLQFTLAHDCTAPRQQETAEVVRSRAVFLSVSEKTRTCCHTTVKWAQHADHVVGG